MNTNDFIQSLSPVKKRIAQLLDTGMSADKVAKKVAKENQSNLSTIVAYVTMVEKAAFKAKVAFNTEKTTYALDKRANSGKNFVHDRVIKEVLFSKVKTGLVLTLAWIEFILERKIYFDHNMKGLSYQSCELDAPTAKQADKFAKKNKLNFVKGVYNGKISDKIYSAKKDAYAHLFLDYCGRLNTFADEIYHAIQKKIVQKDGIIWITLARPYETGTLIMLKKLVNQAGGENYKVEFDYDYRDGKPMSTIIIRRMK